MGDLVVGARSGSGEPEKEDTPVSAVEDAVTGDPVPENGRDADGDGGSDVNKPRSFWKELPILIGIALILALLIKTFLVQAFSIPSASMENTLQINDRVLVDKLTPWFGSDPERGEVVVFHDPGGWLEGNPPSNGNAVTKGLQKALSFIGLMPSAEEKDLIKRVVGVGGDTVECNGTGPLKVNGKALDEPYVYPGNTPCTADKPFKITVPKGHIWVMGDHRQDSLDSRYHMGQRNPDGTRQDGSVPVSDVVGRAIVRAWPIGRWGTLPVPDTFDQPGINAAGPALPAAAGAAVPAAAGLAGSVPLVLLRRRRLTRRVTARSDRDR